MKVWAEGERMTVKVFGFLLRYEPTRLGTKKKIVFIDKHNIS